MEQPLRIALVRLSSLGDVLLATPLARLLRKHFPAAQIDAVVAREFAEVWQSNPYISRVVAVDRSISPKAMLHQSRQELEPLYDIVIDVQCNWRSRMLCKNRARRCLRYSKHRLEKLALVWLKLRPRHVTHVVERYSLPLAHLGITGDGDGLELWLPEERAEQFYPPAQRVMPERHCIGIAPGARHATKQWLPERFIAVGKEFQRRGWSIVLLGSAQEKLLCDEIAHTLDPSRLMLCVGATLYDAARAVDCCSVVLSNDSGIAHLAAARRVPVVVAYGSTVPELGFTPYGVPYRIVQVENLSCRPCTHIGRSRCPRGHFACIRNIGVETVLAAIDSLMVELGEYQSR